MPDHETDRERADIWRPFKCTFALWLVNALLFTALAFLWSWADSIHHWSTAAALVLLWSSGIGKAILSGILILLYIDTGARTNAYFEGVRCGKIDARREMLDGILGDDPSRLEAYLRQHLSIPEGIHIKAHFVRKTPDAAEGSTP